MGAVSIAGTREPSVDRPTTSDPADVAGASRRALSVAFLLVLVAVALIFIATPHGIGITPDSMQYLEAARHILRDDFKAAWSNNAAVFTHFPPGFAVALSAVAGLGMSAESAARVLNAIALIATGLLTFALARRATRGSTTAAIVGAIAVVFSRDVLAAHAMVWSEPLFIPLTLGALLAVAVTIQRDSRPALVAAVLLAGAAGLTRYAAPSVIGAAAVSLAMLGHGPRRVRLARAGAFAAGASLPIVALLAFNAIRAGTATNRQLAFHPMDLEQARSAARTAYYWVLPTGAPQWLELALFVAVGVGVLLYVVSRFRSTAAGREVPVFDQSVPDRAVLACFLAGYLAFLYVTITLFDAQATPDPRLLLPVVPPLIILVVAVLNDGKRSATMRVPTMVVASALGIALASSTALWVASTRRDGLGYAGPAWRSSRLMAAIRDLPRETLVFTNHPSAILAQGGHDAREVPRLASPTSLRPNADYSRQMAAVCARASTTTVVYAHFTLEPLEWFLPSLAEVRRQWRSLPRLVAPDGILDTVPASCASIFAKTGQPE